MNLARDIEHCLKRILGDSSYITSPQRSKLKSGAIVYRITGYGHDLLRGKDNDGKVYYVDREGPFEAGGPQYKMIEVTRETLEAKHNMHFFDWEFYLLEKGPDVVAQELREALGERGHAVSVKVGRGGVDDGPGAGSAYDTSIRVVQLNQPMKPGAVADEAVLNELGAISSELAEVHSPVNDLALRLRSLLITMTLKAKL